MDYFMDREYIGIQMEIFTRDSLRKDYETKSGHGSYQFKDDRIYSGEFCDGVIHGHGTLRDWNGNEYVGEFKNNLKAGYGVLKYTNGCLYKG